jgi:hypothetical protein
LPGQGIGISLDCCNITGSDNLSAAWACPWTEINDIIGGPDGIFVMLYYDHGVSEIPEMH